MLEDLKAWFQKKMFDSKRSSLRQELAQHMAFNKYDKAIEVGKTLYTIEKEGLGPGHESTLQSLAALAAILIDAGKHADAEPYWRELLARRRETLGEEDMSVGQTLRMLGRLTLRLNRPNESVEFYEEALALQLRVLGEDHRETDTTRTELEQIKKNQVLDKKAPAASKSASQDTLLPKGAVIFAVWTRKVGEAAGTPQLLGDLDDAFGDGKGITIGSKDDCKVVLDGPGVAPLHLRIEDKGGVRKMHVYETVILPHATWEHPIESCEASFEAGTLVADPIAFPLLQLGSFQIEYRELRNDDAEALVRYFQNPTGEPPEAPSLVSRVRGPFLPREREAARSGFLVGIFVAEGLAKRPLSGLGDALKSFRETHPYVIRIEGLEEVFAGRYPVFGEVPPSIFIDGGGEPVIGPADSCMLMECKSSVDFETVTAELQAILPAGVTTGVRLLPDGAIRLANFRRRRPAEAAPAAGSAQSAAE